MWAATRDNLTLIVDYDTEPMNPRTDWDNFGKMVCWHRRYNLGDKHDYGDAEDFVTEMLMSWYEAHPTKPIYLLKSRGAENAYLEYNRSTREWNLYEKNGWSQSGEYYFTDSYPANAGKDIPDWFIEKCIQALTHQEQLALLRAIPGLILLPLYLYDHGGITMSTGSFGCCWDSGQVGWIYATADMIRKEYGDAGKENYERARALLESEVQTYDLYLTGQCYGYRCLEGEEEVDSCWGFLGDFDDCVKELPGNIPEAFHSLVEHLELQHTDSIAQYFWNLRHKAR